jgi:hypothetical protein
VKLARSFGGRRSVLWLVPLAIVLANLAWLSAFGSGSRVRQRELERRLQQARRVQSELASRVASREQLWIRATENGARLERLRRERFATERSRFTEQVRELKSLAVRAGLEPDTIAYPQDQLLDFGLVRRAFVFSVDGSYGALRNFLHLLELTPSFLTVEEIGVAEGRGGLAVRLRLSTLFEAVASDAEAEALGLAGGEAEPPTNDGAGGP